MVNYVFNYTLAQVGTTSRSRPYRYNESERLRPEGRSYKEGKFIKQSCTGCHFYQHKQKHLIRQWKFGALDYQANPGSDTCKKLYTSDTLIYLEYFK